MVFLFAMTWLFFFLLIIVFLAFYLYFHRVPKRHSPEGSGTIVAPADGVVWKIVALNGENQVEISKQFMGKIQTLCHDVEDAAYIISIFMNPLDVHVNWSPVNGEIVSVQHTPGNFSFANTWQSLWNEKNEIVIQTSSGYKVKVIQIAGFVARRIRCWVKEGQAVAKGQTIGMIRLGSQVSVILPKQVAIQVKVGQKVRGAETILGTFQP